MRLPQQAAIAEAPPARDSANRDGAPDDLQVGQLRCSIRVSRATRPISSGLASPAAACARRRRTRPPCGRCRRRDGRIVSAHCEKVSGSEVISLGKAALQPFGGKLDWRQRILDFVCDAACDICPRRGALRRLQFGDVVERDDESDWTRLAAHLHADPHDQDAACASPCTMLHSRRHPRTLRHGFLTTRRRSAIRRIPVRSRRAGRPIAAISSRSSSSLAAPGWATR